MAIEQNISGKRAVHWLIVAVALSGALAADSRPAPAAEYMFRARVNGRMLEGKPLKWSDQYIVLLGREGELHEFHPKKAKEAVKTSPRFFGYSQSEVKTLLQQEFKKQFDVSTTRHYVVVHPVGQRDLWGQRFEDLYNRFCHYFRVRGFSLSEPPYPLVAIVFRNEAEYRQHAEASGSPVPPGWLGHYSPVSNRVFLFDQTTSDTTDWSSNADTIIHEATHQTAYNTGIQTRLSATRWLSEGLATMFEARGVWSAQYDHTQADRINRGRLLSFKDLAAKRWEWGMVLNLVASDRMFQTNESDAYALAWALSFYLCETQPRLYCQYLAKAAARPMLIPYTDAERVADFQDIFGSERKMFEIKFLRFMDELK